MRRGTIVDYSGSRFGRLRVVKPEATALRSDGRHRSRFHCLCDCGAEVVVAGCSLTSGNTRSCGCARRIRVNASDRSVVGAHKLKPYQWLYNVMVGCAKSRDLECSLSYEDFIAFAEIRDCHYCGAPIKWRERSRNTAPNNGYHLDRKDNLRGYHVDNCVVACARCNRSRLDNFSYEEWLQIGAVIRAFPQVETLTDVEVED